MTGGSSLSSTVTSLIWQLSIICVKTLRQGKPQWLSSVSHSWTAVETLDLANNGLGERGKFHFNRKLRTFPSWTVFLKWASRGLDECQGRPNNGTDGKQKSEREGWEEDPHERPGFNIHSVDYICSKCSWGKGGGPFHWACPFNKSMVL